MKIIGGKFGLPKEINNQDNLPQFLSDDPLLLFNARACIKIIVDTLKPRICWVPSFLCPTITTAIDLRFTEIKFYPINENLEFSSSKFLKEIQPDDLLLFIDYFGFPFKEDLIEELHNKKVTLLQDCSQALFTDHKKSRADYCFYSPRKFIGVPDGGILHAKNLQQLSKIELLPPPTEILYPLINAVILRREFDRYGMENNWNRYFKLANSQFTPQNIKMSDFSQALLLKGFNYNLIKSQRRRNYQKLLSKLYDFAIFKILPRNVIPLGFPIRINHRDKIQNSLAQKGIFCPIHWEIKDIIGINSSKSLKLSQNILTLPCDQRYQEEDMAYIAEALLEAYNV